MNHKSLAAELHRTEQRLMLFPRSPRLLAKVQDLRRQVAREHDARARALRGQIRRKLMAASLDTLAGLARELEVS